MIDGEMGEQILVLRSRFRGVIEDRLVVIEHALHAATEDSLLPAEREEAERAAHKLTGSLGSLGWPAASAYAREIEHALGGAAHIDARDGAELATLVARIRHEME